MHYNESNQLTLENAMPTTLETLTYYIPNPVMQTEQPGTGVLGRCETYFTGLGLPFNEVITATSFCQGNGMINGGDIILWGSEEITFDNNIALLDNEIFLKQDVYATDVILNPVMQTEESGTGVLGRCENLFEGATFDDEETTATSFCQGNGTLEGLTLLEIAKQYEDTKMLLLSYEVIIPDPTSVIPHFEFTISGKNTTTDKDIWYDVVLTHGDNHVTRTTRIRDDLLKFSLVEIKDGIETTVVDNKSYNDLTNKRIWVDTINKNTTSETTHTYRLYMWISNDTVIGNVNQDYTIEEWNNVFASIKVNVTGDFNEKELTYEDIYNVTNASCFTTTTNADNTLTITDYDTSCGTDVVIPKTINGKNVTTIGEYAFQLNHLTSVVIPNSVTEIGYAAFSDNQLTNVVIPDSVTTIGEYVFSNNQLTSVVIPNSVTRIEYAAFENNQITSVIIPDSVTYLSCSAFDNDVVITKNDNLECEITPD